MRKIISDVVNFPNGCETVYNKLVRDHIPDIIKANGQTPLVRTLDEADFLSALDQKFREEMNEYLASGSLEELCDVLEVAHAIAKVRGYSEHDIDKLRSEKNKTNGAFEKRLFLERVIGDAP